MLKVYRTSSVVLLLFNLVGALYGGINLVTHPDGSSIQLSLELLEHTPFDDYLLPGTVLLVVNGLFCGFVVWKVLQNDSNFSKLIIAQGILLTGWIIIQMLLIRTVFFLHFVLGGTGLALIVLGWLQHRFQKK